MEKSQVIISLGAGVNQISLIKEIKDNGFECIAFDRNPDAPGFEFADYYEPISSYDYKKIINYLENNNEILSRTIGVLTRSTGMPVLSAAKIAKHFGFKYMNVEIAELIVDKANLLTKLNKLGIPSPKVVVTQGEIPETINFPVFVKPSKTILSHTAMKKCYGIDELKVAVEKACEVSDNGKANIEEFLVGYDIVSIDFVENGKILHVCNIGELTRGEPDFVGLGWYTAFKEADDVVAETMRIFVEKLKIEKGFFQTAMKVSKDFKSAKIYEVHGEIGGDLTSDVFLPQCYDGYSIFRQNINFITNNRIYVPNNEVFCCLIFDELDKSYAFNGACLRSIIFDKQNKYSFIKFIKKDDFLCFMRDYMKTTRGIQYFSL